MHKRPGFAGNGAFGTPSIAFYYAHADQSELLAQFDVAVIEPDHGFEPHDMASSGTQWLAYISIGEVLESRPHFKTIPDNWLIGTNTTWQAHIIDQTAAGWPAFLIQTIARPLWQRGYQGFFLDTMDSWCLLEGDETQRAHQAQGLTRAIHALRRAFPQAVIITNRGFELLPDIHEQIDALAFESLYLGWDEDDKKYINIPANDRTWLLNQSARASQLPFIAIDYCPPLDSEGTRQTIERIRAHGIVPSINDAYFQTINPQLLSQTLYQASD